MTITVSEAGKLGAKARQRNLSPERRKEIAKAGGFARQKKRQLEIDRNLATALVSLNEKAEGIK